MARPPVYAEIGEIIRRRRKTIKRTQQQIAGRLGISRASLANIETGRQNILVHQIYELARALELDPHDLIPKQMPPPRKASAPELPIPDDLKPLQRQQIAQLIESTPLEPSPRPEERHGKQTKK